MKRSETAKRSRRGVPSFPRDTATSSAVRALPAGRESVIARIRRKIREFKSLNIEIQEFEVSIDRMPYPCPLCGGVVFPSDPGRENGEEEGRAEERSRKA